MTVRGEGVAGRRWTSIEEVSKQLRAKTQVVMLPRGGHGMQVHTRVVLALRL